MYLIGLGIGLAINMGLRCIAGGIIEKNTNSKGSSKGSFLLGVARIIKIDITNIKSPDVNPDIPSNINIPSDIDNPDIKQF